MRYLVKVHEYIVKKCLVKTVLLENKIYGGPNWAFKMSKAIKVDISGKKVPKSKIVLRKKNSFRTSCCFLNRCQK